MLANTRVSAVLVAVDLERVRNFYEEKLGLQAAEMADGLVVECGQGTELFLYQRDTPSQAEHTVAAFTVNNIEEMVQSLRDRGVEFEQYDLPGLKTDEQGIATIAKVKGAWFKDTEGNILSIVQLR